MMCGSAGSSVRLLGLTPRLRHFPGVVLGKLCNVTLHFPVLKIRITVPILLGWWEASMSFIPWKMQEHDTATTEKQPLTYLHTRNENLRTHKKLYVDVSGGFSHNLQKLGTSRCPPTGEYTMEHHSTTERHQLIYATRRNLKRLVKRKESDSKGYTTEFHQDNTENGKL